MLPPSGLYSTISEEPFPQNIIHYLQNRQELLRNIISSIVVERHNVKLNLFIYPQIFVDRKRAVTHAFTQLVLISDSSFTCLYISTFIVLYRTNQPVLEWRERLKDCA